MSEWSDYLAEYINEYLVSFKGGYLANNLISRYFDGFDNIETYSHVTPFLQRNPENILAELRITLVYREDRPWILSDVIECMDKNKYMNLNSNQVKILQDISFNILLHTIQLILPEIGISIIGVANKGDFSAFEDLREPIPNADTEKFWLERCAQSLIVIGVHGSHMLLPSAHAGSVIKFMEPYSWAHVTNDLIITKRFNIEDLFALYSVLPKVTPLEEILNICIAKTRKILSTVIGSPESYVEFLKQKKWEHIDMPGVGMKLPLTDTCKNMIRNIAG
jgi:hypothetical protein